MSTSASAPTVDMIVGWLQEAIDAAGIALDWYEGAELADEFRKRLEKGLGVSNIRPLKVGDVVHGFAYGIFGRDHYNCVRVEAVGADWAVTRQANNCVEFIGGAENLAFAMRARDEPCANQPYHCLEKEGL